MEKADPKNQEPRFIDNPHAPEVFADEACGFFLMGDTLRMTFTSLRVEHSANPGPTNRVVIGRLVMTIAAAEGFQKGLADFLQTMKKAQQATGAMQ